MDLKGKKVTIHDMCLRDGMHPKRHLITVEEMVDIASAMDAAGIPLIEVTHGDGLGGASVNYGFPAASDEEYLSAVCREMKNAKVSALLLPGIGTVDHLKMAVDCGIATIRVATHCTEADVSEQHIKMAASIDGLDTVGFLMMAHMIEPEELLAQLKLMEDYGANCVYITDSAGYMLPEDVTARVALARAELNPETEVGFHGHHNLAMGIANSLAAVEAGASRIDGSLAGLGVGAGAARPSAGRRAVRAAVGENFVKDEAAYQQDAFYPQAVAQLGDLFVFRDQNKQQLVFYPFAFNPVTGELNHYKRIQVRIDYVDDLYARVKVPITDPWTVPVSAPADLSETLASMGSYAMAFGASPLIFVLS